MKNIFFFLNNYKLSPLCLLILKTLRIIKVAPVVKRTDFETECVLLRLQMINIQMENPSSCKLLSYDALHTRLSRLNFITTDGQTMLQPIKIRTRPHRSLRYNIVYILVSSCFNLSPLPLFMVFTM